MRVCIIALAVCLLVVSTSAAPPRPYVGGSANIGAIAETLSPLPRPVEGTVSNPQAYTIYGAQVEGGWMGSFWDIHLGARFSYARDREQQERDLGHSVNGYESSHDWYNYRLSFGPRLRVSDNADSPVKPSLGAGVSYGWLRRTSSYKHWDNWQGMEPHVYVESSARNYPGGCFGWWLETGFWAVPRGALRYSLLFRFEDYQLDVNDDPPNYHVFNGAVQLTAELGVFYTFPRLTH